MDKISYALGLGIGQQLKNMNIENFSIESFAKSIADVMSGAKTEMTAVEAQKMLNEYFQEKEAQDAKKNIEAGKAYLKENVVARVS